MVATTSKAFLTIDGGEEESKPRYLCARSTDLPREKIGRMDTQSETPRPISKKKHMIFWVSIHQLWGVFYTILITWRCKLRSHRNPMAKVLWCYFPRFRRCWTVPSMFQGQTCVICTLGSTNIAGLEDGPWMIEDVFYLIGNEVICSIANYTPEI